MHTNSGHTHTHAAARTHTIIQIHVLMHTRRGIAYAQAHIQTHTSTTWCGQYVRAKHNLAFEPVTIIGSMKKCCRENLFRWQTTRKLFLSPLTALKVKDTYIFPKHWLVHVERLHCAVLYLCVVVPYFTQGNVRFGRVFYNQRRFSFFHCCVVTVKATWKLVLTLRCFQTQNRKNPCKSKKKLYLLSRKHRI